MTADNRQAQKQQVQQTEQTPPKVTAKNTKVWLLLAVLVAIAVIAVIILLAQQPKTTEPDQPQTAGNKPQKEEPEYNIKKTVRYSITVENHGNRLIKKPTITVAAPLEITATQKTTNIKATTEYQLKTDNDGNRYLEFTPEYIAPYASKIIEITVNLLHAPGPKITTEKAEQIEKEYIEPQPLIEVENPEIKRLAAALKKKSEKKKTSKKSNKETENINSRTKLAKTAYNWIKRNIQYSGYLSEARGALYALKNRKGDCTEFAYLYTALLRANKIPARVVSGFVYEGNAILDPRNYHDWVEYYADSRWHTVDLQGKKFKEATHNYIAVKTKAVIKKTVKTKTIKTDGRQQKLKQEKQEPNQTKFITATDGLTVKLNKK